MTATIIDSTTGRILDKFQVEPGMRTAQILTGDYVRHEGRTYVVARRTWMTDPARLRVEIDCHPI